MSEHSADHAGDDSLACDCGHSVLDLRGIKPGEKIQCTYCNRIHIVPDTKASHPTREEASQNHKHPPTHSGEKKRPGDHKADASESGTLEALAAEHKKRGHSHRHELPVASGARKWITAGIYLLVLLIVGLLGYMKLAGERDSGYAQYTMDWGRYSINVWILMMVIGVLLGLIGWVLHVWLFIYRPKMRHAVRQEEKRQAAENAAKM